MCKVVQTWEPWHIQLIKGWEIQGPTITMLPFWRGHLASFVSHDANNWPRLKGSEMGPDPRTVIEIGVVASDVAWPKKLRWFEALRPLPIKCVEFRPIKGVGRAEAEKPTERRQKPWERGVERWETKAEKETSGISWTLKSEMELLE